MYVERHPELLSDVSGPGLYLQFSQQVALAIRLHEYKLLPEEMRQKFSQTVASYALQGQDLYVFEDNALRCMMTETEFNELRVRIQREFVPRLSTVRREFEADYKSNESAEDHMERFLTPFVPSKRNLLVSRKS